VSIQQKQESIVTANFFPYAPFRPISDTTTLVLQNHFHHHQLQPLLHQHQHQQQNHFHHHQLQLLFLHQHQQPHHHPTHRSIHCMCQPSVGLWDNCLPLFLLSNNNQESSYPNRHRHLRKAGDCVG
jgi:hypothetical protein